MRIPQVKQALKRGEVQLGCLVSQLRVPEAVSALAAAGLDWIFLDAEHGAFDLETLQLLSRTAARLGLCPLVRVADLQYPLVARALDGGAYGIVLPRVESAARLEEAIGWTRYPPIGTRGYGLGPAHLEFEAVTIAEAVAQANARTLVVVQIETAAALERIDEILAVPNIDAVLIGPADLSVSLGVPGEFEHPALVAAVEAICASCRRHGVAPGMHLRTLALAKHWRERGIKLLSCGSDIGFLLEKAGETVAALR